MCLITFGKMPNETAIRTAAENNSDGIGVAWLTRKGVVWRKNVSVPYLLSLPDAVKNSCALHFRIATVGGIKKELSHPFPVTRGVSVADTGRANSVIFHNGHLHDWERVQSAIKGAKLKGPISDSRILARLVYEYGHRILNLFPAQKVLYLGPGKALLYGQGWTESDGTHYSNTSYKEERLSLFDLQSQWDLRMYDWKRSKEEKSATAALVQAEKEWERVTAELTDDMRIVKEPVS